MILIITIITEHHCGFYSQLLGRFIPISTLKRVGSGEGVNNTPSIALESFANVLLFLVSSILAISEVLELEPVGRLRDEMGLCQQEPHAQIPKT